jgi:hypothetical protein
LKKTAVNNKPRAAVIPAQKQKGKIGKGLQKKEKE